MSAFQKQITTLVNTFVEQVTREADAIAKAMIDAAIDAANGTAARRLAARGTAAAPAVTRSPSPIAARTPASTEVAPRRKGEKRPTAELARARERVATFIAEHPGLRIEEINQRLGTSTRDLALPLRKLIADGVLRTEGEKRSTRYYPAHPVAAKSTAPSAPLTPQRRRRT